jgi:hypothetical protein
MTTIQLVHHLLWLFAHNTHDRSLWLGWYRSQLPGMPRGWYAAYARYGIRHYPHAMNACLHLLKAHASTATLRRWCP